jgi:hypothetical protein
VQRRVNEINSMVHEGTGSVDLRRVTVIAAMLSGGKTPLPSVTKTPESGVGDEAYFPKAKGMVFNLSVKKGGTYFRVMARSNPEAFAKTNTPAVDQKDREIDLAIARAIVKKLQRAPSIATVTALRPRSSTT